MTLKADVSQLSNNATQFLLSAHQIHTLKIAIGQIAKKQLKIDTVFLCKCVKIVV